ncbi:MAG: cation-efflux pump [Herpetosiphon sp.]
MTVTDVPLSTTKQSAALGSIGAGAVLTILKLAVGFATGSLGILSEAAHSGLDLLAAALTYVVVRVSDLPPDENHPYGHARAENLGALAESSLLLATAGWVLWKAYQHIFISPESPEITVWSFVVMLVSLMIDWHRSRSLSRAATSLNSPALAADAAHFANDMFGTLMVLIGLSVTLLARFISLPGWLAIRADAFAAVGVAVVALYVSWGLGRHAVRALMDDVPTSLNEQLRSEIDELTGIVTGSTRVRSRFVGNQPYVDVNLQVPRTQTLEEAHRTTEDVEAAVRTQLFNADVVVHVEPVRGEGEAVSTTVYAAAHKLGLHVHNLDVFLLQAGMYVDVDLEVPAALSLAEAHRYSEEFEMVVRRELAITTEVSVHLEPRRDLVQPAVRWTEVQNQVGAVLRDLDPALPTRAIEGLLTDEGAIVTLRCEFPASLSLLEVHHRMARLERTIRQAIPGLLRVHIDPEPGQ